MMAVSLPAAATGARGRVDESRRQLKRQADAIASRVRGMFPAMNVEVAYRWGGAFATTEDSLPIVGTRPEFPNTGLRPATEATGLPSA